MRFVTLLLAAATLVAANGGGVLRGTVRAEGSLEPLAYALVEIPGLGRTAVADARGYYVLPDVPPGRWTVKASALGYGDVSIEVLGSDSGSVTIDFELPLRPLRIPGVTTWADRPSAGLVLDQPGAAAGPPSVRLAGPGLRLMPGLAEPDILRSLQILPSVAATSDYSSALYVRGGSSDQTGLTLDGFPLFNPYHVGGIFSALPTEAISSVEVWPGAAPARSGDRLSGAVEMRTRDGARDRVRANGSLGLLSTSVGLEGPLPGSHGSFLFSGRSTYVDAITNAAAALGLIPMGMPYGLWDVYGKLSHDVGESGTVTVLAYRYGERFRVEPPNMEPAGTSTASGVDVTETDFAWGSTMVGAAYRTPLGSALLLEARAGYSGFEGGFRARDIFERFIPPTEQEESGSFTIDSIEWLDAGTRTQDVLGSLDLTWYGSRHTLRAGTRIDAYRLHTDMRLRADHDPGYFPPFDRGTNLRTIAAHVEDEWRTNDWLQLRAGLRYLNAERLGSAWLPRLGVRVQVTPELALSAGGGVNAQALRSMKDEESVAASFIAYDVLDAQPPDVGLARSWDVVAGTEWRGKNGLMIRADAFVKRMEGLVLPPDPFDPALAPPFITDSFRIGKGRASGFEILATGALGELEFTGGYNLLVSERRVGEGWYTPRFERRHTLDLNAARPLGGAGLLTARLTIATGQPYTPTIGEAQPLSYSPVHGWRRDHRVLAILGEQNSRRLPGYVRADVAYRRSFERKWFGRNTTLTPYFQIVNLFNNRNVLVGVPEAGRELKLAYLPQLPIFPTFGIEWRF